MMFWTLLMLWTAAAASAAAFLWRRMASHRKVYVFILVHGLYSAGVFFLYDRLVSR